MSLGSFYINLFSIGPSYGTFYDCKKNTQKKAALIEKNPHSERYFTQDADTPRHRTLSKLLPKAFKN